jgi:hypothetical protein
MHCPNCGEPNSIKNRQCLACGNALTPEVLMSCPNSYSVAKGRCTSVDCNCDLMLALMQRKIDAQGFFDEPEMRKTEILHLLDILGCAREFHMVPEVREYCDKEITSIMSRRSKWQ